MVRRVAPFMPSAIGEADQRLSRALRWTHAATVRFFDIGLTRDSSQPVAPRLSPVALNLRSNPSMIRGDPCSRRVWPIALAVGTLPGWTATPPAALAADEPVRAAPLALIAAPARPTASSAAGASNRVEVWIDLDIPAVAARPALSAEARTQHLGAIDAQQSALRQQLQRWAAVERGRVRIVRNAVVVEVPESALEDIRRLPGVTGVSRVTHPHHIQPAGPQLR